VSRLILQTAARMFRRHRILTAAGGVAVLAGTGVVTALATGAAAPASLPPPASTLRLISDFGHNPTGLRMYLYVPRRVRPHPAVVVAMHYCTGSGPAMFAKTEFASLADRYGFVVVYPSVPRAGHCFDVSSLAATTHSQAYYSDPGTIVAMVQWTERHLNADPHRIFATGVSSGAEMTAVLLGDYPNVFRAGSVMSGVPFGCFGTVAGPEACVHGTIAMTAQKWGDMVRLAYPSYRGPRPPIQLWHGTADTTLYYPDFRDEIRQWTNVLGARLARTDHPKPSWTHSVYTNQSGEVAVDAYSVAGETHQLGFHFPDWAQYAIRFFGLTRDHGGDPAGAHRG
jgi:acetylxylan esterase